MVEHPHGVEEDGDADEGLEVIQQLEDEAEGHVAAIATHFVAEFLGRGGAVGKIELDGWRIED